MYEISFITIHRAADKYKTKSFCLNQTVSVFTSPAKCINN